MECSDLSRWDFFIERFAWQTKKNWAFSVLVAAISAALHESFVRTKYAYSGCQFLLYWMRIICCICKDFVRQLKAFFPSFCHSCACEMSLGWGHLVTRMDPRVGYLNSILARGGGIWTIIFKKVKCPGSCPGGGCWSLDLTDTLDRDENLLWSGLQWHRSCHSSEMKPSPIMLAAIFLRGNCSSEIDHKSFFLR